jgi:hypothetical protein
MGRGSGDLEVQAVAAACAGAVSVAVQRWAGDGGRLSEHVDVALSALEDSSHEPDRRRT